MVKIHNYKLNIKMLFMVKKITAPTNLTNSLKIAGFLCFLDKKVVHCRMESSIKSSLDSVKNEE